MRRRTVKDSDITKSNVLHELACIAFANISDYTDFKTDALKKTLTRDEAAAISEIIQSKDGIKVKFYDKMKALDMLSKQMGYYEADDSENGENGVVILAETENIE